MAASPRYFPGRRVLVKLPGVDPVCRHAGQYLGVAPRASCAKGREAFVTYRAWLVRVDGERGTAIVDVELSHDDDDDDDGGGGGGGGGGDDDDDDDGSGSGGGGRGEGLGGGRDGGEGVSLRVGHATTPTGRARLATRDDRGASVATRRIQVCCLVGGPMVCVCHICDAVVFVVGAWWMTLACGLHVVAVDMLRCCCLGMGVWNRSHLTTSSSATSALCFTHPTPIAAMGLLASKTP